MGSARLAGGLMAEPFHVRIRRDLRARIASGEFPPGAKLPSTANLVAYYREAMASPTLSTFVVRQAITLMIEAGELRGQQGLGVYVPLPDDDDGQ